MFKIEMLEAYEGDSFLVTYGEENSLNYLIIDAGRKETYRDLVEKIDELNKPVELFVMTHIDDDHIYGALPLFSDSRINKETFKDIWYNGFAHLDPEAAKRPQSDMLGPQNGEFFTALLLKEQYSWNEAFNQGATVVIPKTGDLTKIELADGMTLTILSPTWDSLLVLKDYWENELKKFKPGDSEAAWEAFSHRKDLQPDDVLGSLIDVDGLNSISFKSDSSEPNGSSIAFLAEYNGQAALFLGDAHSSIVEKSIRRLLKERGQTLLKLDVLKVSHHGSKNNTSHELLQLLNCRRFLISTNGKLHNHPDKETIARILHRNQGFPYKTELYFNYVSEFNKTWDDGEMKSKWKYITHYPPDGCSIHLAETQ